MTRSIVVATLFAAGLAGCAQKPAEPPPVAAAASTNLVPYCGPVWSVGRQGYVQPPCPGEVNYGGAR